MSRKRYSSGSQRGSPHQGKYRTTSTQQASYDDSLAADCLIRSFMEKGNMEDPVLIMLFIGGSRPKENETEFDLLFRRMKTCWMEKGKNYGMKEFLKSKMREAQIETEIDQGGLGSHQWGRLLLSTPKYGSLNKVRKEDFQLEKFRDDQILSESATRIQKVGFIKALPELISDQLMIHRWDSFPDKNPVMIRNLSKRTFHLIVDDCDTLHHVILHGGQQEILNQSYQCRKQDSIQLIQQDWSQFISVVRGKMKILAPKERKKQERESSIDSSQMRNIFHQLELSYKQVPSGQEPIEEIVSDQDSQSSRGQEKQQKGNIDVSAQEWRLATRESFLKTQQRQRGPLPQQFQ